MWEIDSPNEAFLYACLNVEDGITHTNRKSCGQNAAQSRSLAAGSRALFVLGYKSDRAVVFDAPYLVVIHEQM